MAVTGFGIYEELNADAGGLAPEIENFLMRVIRLSFLRSAPRRIFDTRSFYESSAEAVRKLGRRAILLAGPGL